MMGSVAPAALREQRRNPSVLKSELAALREKNKCLLVVVLEGKEDLAVYEAWIKRLLGDFAWEPLVANGKRNALDFLRLLRRDMTGMRACTIFVVDHDYDGLAGIAPGSEIFVLPAYSVENYLADESVVDSYLRADLRVVGQPEVRNAILASYNQLEKQFHDAILPHCQRLFGARNEPVGNIRIKDLPRTLKVGPAGAEFDQTVVFDDVVSTEIAVSQLGLDSAKHFFAGKASRLWVRGKFSLSFFKEFCEYCQADRASDQPAMFPGVARDRSLSAASLDIRTLASRSPIPDGLLDFLARNLEQCREECIA